MKGSFFFFLFFSFLSAFAQSHDKVLQLSGLSLEADKTVDISDYFTLIEVGQIDLDTVFTDLRLDLSETHSITHHRLELSTGESNDAVVLILNPNVEYFDIVKYSNVVDTEYFKTGRNCSAQQAAYYSTFANVLPIDVRPNEQITLYIKSIHTEPFTFYAEIKNYERFDNRVGLRLINSYIFTAILLAFAVYNFILSFFVKERVYFYYSYYVLSLAGYASLAALTTILSVSIVSTMSIVISAVVIALAALFSGEFLPINKYLQRSKFLYWMLLYSAPVISVLLLVNYSMVESPGLEKLTVIYTALLGLMSIPFWLWVGYRIFRNKDVRGRLFLITNIPILVGACLFIVVWMLDYFSIIGVSVYLAVIVTLTFQISILLQLFLFSIVIGHNITRLQREKFQIQKKQNVELEQKVEERTASLVKANESINQQKTELAELNEVKDKLFSIVSHDLRSPLNAVKSILGFLQEGKLSADEIKLYAKTLEGSVNGTMSLLDNLLYWAKAQMEGIEPKPTDIDIKALIEKNLKLAEFQYKEKNIQVSTNFESETVRADYDMIDLVIRNLVSNAIKFTGKEGEIELRTVRNGDFVDFAIKDNGVGMTEEVVNELFNWDSAVASYGTNNEKGYGLGLKLCKDFVEINKGQVSVESQSGEGSTFTITLPQV